MERFQRKVSSDLSIRLQKCSIYCWKTYDTIYSIRVYHGIILIIYHSIRVYHGIILIIYHSIRVYHGIILIISGTLWWRLNSTILILIFIFAKKLSFCQKLLTFNLYIFATWSCKPLIFKRKLFDLAEFIVWKRQRYCVQQTQWLENQEFMTKSYSLWFENCIIRFTKKFCK